MEVTKNLGMKDFWESFQAKEGSNQKTSNEFGKLMYATRRGATAGTTGTESVHDISLQHLHTRYPPGTQRKPLEELTPEIIEDLKKRYNAMQLVPDSDEMNKFLDELYHIGVISEKDYQTATLGQPMGFDEKGQPMGWMKMTGIGESSYGQTAEAEKEEDDIFKMLMDLIDEICEQNRIRFEELEKKGEGSSNLAKLHQNTMETYDRIGKVIDKIFGEDETSDEMVE